MRRYEAALSITKHALLQHTPIVIVKCLLNAPLQAALLSTQTPLFVVHAIQLTTPY